MVLLCFKICKKKYSIGIKTSGYFITFAYYFNTYSVILLKYQSVVYVTVDYVKYNKRFNNTCL